MGDRLNASTVRGAENPDISNRDVVAAYLGLLVQGKNDFDHIEAFRGDQFYSLSLGLKNVPSSPTLRQRLDQAVAHAEVRRRERVIRIFPNVDSALRLIGAVLVEKDEEWSTDKRYLNLDAYWEWKKLAQEGTEALGIQAQAA